MFKLLANFLILLVVTSNVVWAADLDEAFGQQYETQTAVLAAQAMDQQLASGSELVQELPCNHCCHGSAHSAGIIADIRLPYLPVAPVPKVSELYAFNSRFIDPPPSPPNI